MCQRERKRAIARLVDLEIASSCDALVSVWTWDETRVLWGLMQTRRQSELYDPYARLHLSYIVAVLELYLSARFERVRAYNVDALVG